MAVATSVGAREVMELHPVITYRHLLSAGLGIRNPLRVVGLTDLDAYYAACEQIRLGIDPEEPLVVRQWDALIAVNYPARKYGITRMERINVALEKCPHLHVVHVATFDPSVPDAKPVYTDNPDSKTHKVSLDHYRKESKKIMDSFKEMLPGAQIERASIDEAFIDLTEPIRKHILAHLSHLAIPPPEGLDTPLPPPPPEGIPLSYPPSRQISDSSSDAMSAHLWRDLGNLIPVTGKPTATAPPPSKKESDADGDCVAPPSASHRKPLDSPNKLHASNNPSREWSAELEEHGHEDFDQEDVSSLTNEDDDDAPEADIEEENQTAIDGSDAPLTWHDVALSIGASMLLRMRDEVKNRLGYTTSSGLARNKFLAKLVASYKKRDSQSILRNAAIPNFLHSLPFQKIRFLGGKLGKALAAEYGAQTVGDLLNISIEEMQRRFGESSIWVWEILRGIDRSEVKEKPSIPKSMGASKNLQRPVTHPSEGTHWLRILAGELAFRLQEAREENPGLWPRTLVLHVNEAWKSTRSKQTPFPSSRNPNMDYIVRIAEKLWAELVGTSVDFDKQNKAGRKTEMKITHVALAFTGVEVMAAGQRSIEGFFAGESGGSSGGKNKRGVGDTGLGYGDGNGDDGTPSKKKARRDINPNVGKPGILDLADSDAKAEAAAALEVSFPCSRCSKIIRKALHSREGYDEFDREDVLASLKMEHDDFHFARDLARGERLGGGGAGNQDDNDDTSTTANKPRDNRSKKKKSKPDITKFFKPVSSSSTSKSSKR